MKSVCRVALALFVPVAALAAETIAFERYQTIIDRQPFGQPPPGFNPSQMASEVQKGVAAAAEVELTVEQQELQKVVGFSVLNRNGEDYWVGISVPSAGDPKQPSHYYMKVGDTRDGWFVKSADPLKKTAVVVKDEVEIELTLGTPFNGGAGANAKVAAAKNARTMAAPAGRSGLLARRAGGGEAGADGSSAAPTSFAGRRARREAEAAALAAEAAAREEERRAREEEAKARAEEERAAREAERAEQRQQLMDIREELRKAREEKERQRQEAADNAASETETAPNDNDES